MNKSMKQIMEKQDKTTLVVARLQDDINHLRSELNRCYKKVAEIEKDLFDSKIKDPKHYVFNLIENDKVAYKELIRKLNQHPEFMLARKLEDEYLIKKYEYYFAIGDCFKMIEDDRKELFTKDYLRRLDELADDGWFMYHLRAPEFDLLNNNSDFEKYFVDIISRDNYAFLDYFLAKTLNPGRDKNDLRLKKINDMKEVISNLKDGYYSSAARTMFTLLENDHTNASDIKVRSSGHQRSKEINKFVTDLESKYLINAWNKINIYYKLITSSKDNTGVINRNKLVHGYYDYVVTNVDILKLIFMFSSFKEISFNIQIRLDFKEDLERDKALLEMINKNR